MHGPSADTSRCAARQTRRNETSAPRNEIALAVGARRRRCGTRPDRLGLRLRLTGAGAGVTRFVGGACVVVTGSACAERTRRDLASRRFAAAAAARASASRRGARGATRDFLIDSD
jgi:hypothetical protein